MLALAAAFLVTAGGGLSHGLLGARAEVRWGPVGVFGALGFPQFAYGSYDGAGVNPAGGIRLYATPVSRGSWSLSTFLSAQVGKFETTIRNDAGCCEWSQENRTSYSATVGLDARNGPVAVTFGIGPAFTQYRRTSQRGGGAIQDSGLQTSGGLGTEGFIPDFELAVGFAF